jgi:hypothetical protein
MAGCHRDDCSRTKVVDAFAWCRPNHWSFRSVFSRGLLQLADSANASLPLLGATAANGIIAFAIILAMSLGVIVPKIVIDSGALRRYPKIVKCRLASNRGANAHSSPFGIAKRCHSLSNASPDLLCVYNEPPRSVPGIDKRVAGDQGQIAAGRGRQHLDLRRPHNLGFGYGESRLTRGCSQGRLRTSISLDSLTGCSTTGGSAGGSGTVAAAGGSGSGGSAAGMGVGCGAGVWSALSRRSAFG